MILSASYYFLYYAALAFLFPFLSLFYQSHNLSGSQIGILMGISPLITLFSAPFWTGMADATHKHKRVMVVTILGTVTLALILSGQSTFYWFLSMVCLYSFFAAPIVSLADSAVMSQLGENKNRYGRIRLWGTFGWGIFAPVAGIIIDRSGIQWAFWGYAVLMLIGLGVALFIPFRQEISRIRFTHGMRAMFANQRWMLFLMMVFISGVGMASINNYLALYLTDMGASKTLIGWGLTITTISEIPVLFFANRLLQWLKVRGVLILAMLAISTRVLLYSITHQPEMILVIQLIHGFTFPIILAAGVSYADLNAPPGMKATAQGMFGSALWGFGAGAGGILGGFLYQRFGFENMYRIVGILVLVGLLLFLALERHLKGNPNVEG